MRWRDGIGITLEEFESVFVAIFGLLRDDEDLVDRMLNLNFASVTAVNHGEHQLCTADLYLSRLRTIQLPTQTPPTTVVVATPPPPQRSSVVRSRVGSTLPDPSRHPSTKKNKQSFVCGRLWVHLPSPSTEQVHRTKYGRDAVEAYARAIFKEMRLQTAITAAIFTRV